MRNVYTRKGPASTPEDLKGTKIRVMNNPIEAKIWSTIGTIPTPMNFGEVYQSLQTGVLDAAENGALGHRVEPPLRGGEDHHPHRAPALALAAVLQRAQVQRPAGRTSRRRCSRPGARPRSIQRKRDTELNAEAIDRMKAKGTTFVMPDRAEFLA